MIGLVALAGVTLSSCSVTSLIVTDNAIGAKKGAAVAKPFQKDADFSYKKAAENGKVDKIGSATFTVTNLIFGVKIETVVTGE